MKEQIYQIPKMNTFCLQHIFECGQCFRWNKEKDGSYTGVFQNNVLNVKEEKNTITFQGICKQDIEKVVVEYFDLQRNYEEIQKILNKVDEPLKQSISYGKGIRLLNQDLWETIISFIISANNNIPRIKGIIERVSKQYGNKIEWREKEYYTFPSIEQLAKANIGELRALGLGFRDKYIYETTQMILKQEVDIEELQLEQETQKVKEMLLKLSGVGPKVADCIMLFSTLKRLEVFPIDVWVRRVMNDLYIHHPQEEKVNKKEIEKLAKQKYGELAGIAQQYLFYWKREA